MKEAEKGRLLVLRRKGKILTLLFEGNRLLRAEAYEDKPAAIGSIYIGKVKNVVTNIHAAFVEFKPGELCFLSLKDCREPIITNREYDGRILPGDEILLQIYREAQKTKEAGASTNLSFSGKYAVLNTEKRQSGYSSRLSEEKKAWLDKLCEDYDCIREIKEKYGLIFRSSIENLDVVQRKTEASETVLQEILYLKEELEKVMETTRYRTCYSVMRQALPAYLKVIQDWPEISFSKILTDDKSLFVEIGNFLGGKQSEDAGKLAFYEDSMVSLSSLYSVETKLSEALKKHVWMKSGAYLVVEHTEAMTCIDVNSGKCIDKKSPEEIYLKINLEAAEEIGRQLILRNLSGIIIVDFISLKSRKDRELLMREFQKITARDSVKTEVVDMTALGLVEVTRKKQKKSLWEQMAD